MITGSQVRSARALLDWTRDELAKKCGIAPLTIKYIEDGAVQPQVKTIEGIANVINTNGVEFIERGVRWTDDMVKVLDGDDAHLKTLDDIYYSLHKAGGEALFLCSSDRYAIKGEYEAEVRLRDAGIRFRSLIEEGNNKTVWPRKEYRQIPKDYFNHNLQVIYGDKVAQILENGKRVLIVHNASLATTARNMFDLIWSLMRPMPKEEKKNEK